MFMIITIAKQISHGKYSYNSKLFNAIKRASKKGDKEEEEHAIQEKAQYRDVT
jgi:hypothetical protein